MRAAEPARDSGPCELRVHGIGNHGVWSALGAPRYRFRDERTRASSVLPPALVGHRLCLFNWSRVTRSGTSLLWYLVLPFTILNAVAAMRPPRNAGLIRQQRVLAWAFSLGLTTLVAVWSMSIGEQLLEALRLGSVLGPRSHAYAVAGIATALVAALVIRELRSADRSWAWTPHAATVVGVLAVALIYRPAQLEVDPTSWLGYVSTSGFSKDVSTAVDGTQIYHSAAYVDPLATSTFALLGFAVLAQLHGATLPKRSVVGDEVATPVRATILCGLLSYVLGALFVSTLAVTLPSMVTRSLAGVTSRLPTSDYDPDQAIIAPRLGPSYASSTLPLLMLLTLVALAVVVVSVTGARSHIRLPGFRVPRSDAPRQGASSPSPVESRQEEVARFDFLTWSHRLLVNDLPRTMSRLSFWGSLTLVALVAASSALVSDRQDRDSLMGVVTTSAGGIAAPPHGAYPFLYSWVDFLVAASLALTLYTIRKAGSWAPLRATLNNIADVAGFWPRSIAPWGARSYRQTVCESLARAIAIEGTKDVVLVGHSQGSVIAAWLVAHRSEFGLDPPRGLVTCGSPLQSLYARLFPSHVGEALYGRIADEGVPWVNCWRSTDPIAAPIAAGTVRNLKLADGPGSAAGEWQGHSEYWVNVRQQAAIRRLLGYSQPGWRG